MVTITRQNLRINPYLLIVLATMIMGLSGSLIKMVALPATVLTFFRTFIPTVILLTYFGSRGINIFRKGNWLVYIASVVSCIRLFLFVVSFSYTSIGNAVIVLYTWPIFANFFGVWILKEKIQRRNQFLMTLPFLGVVILFANQEFSFENSDLIGMSTMLLSAIMYAWTVVVFKKESSKFESLEIVFFQNIAGGILFFPLIFTMDGLPSILQLSGAFTYGFLMGIGAFFLFFTALKKIKASSASLMNYLEVVFAMLYGYVFFHEEITLNMAIGGSLIIFSTILMKKN